MERGFGRPPEGMGSHEDRENRERAEERIENGVWRPGMFEAYADKVAVGTTTKLLEKRKNDAGHTPRLRITGDVNRAIDDRDELEKALRESGSDETVDDYRGRKVAAGVQLTRMLRELDGEADPRRMLKTRLTHGTDIVTVDEEYLSKPKEELVEVKADGMITRLKHVPLMAAAADCAPVIVFDPKTEAVGIFHSGYRGTESGIGPKGVARMVEEFGCDPADLRVAVGPYADGQSYEIGRDFMDRLREQRDDEGNPRYDEEDIAAMFSAHPTDDAKVMYDNGEAIRIQMKKAGVPDDGIEVSRMSTMRDNDAFSSDRVEGFDARDTLMAMAVLK